MNQLLADFLDMRADDPTIRTVDAAGRLGVPEGALVEARANTEAVTRLRPQGAGFADLIAEMPAVGRVMTLTRNPAAVHETKGVFGDVDFSGAMGQVTGAIDLRLFTSRWHAGYHITEETKSGPRSSFQVFSGDGRSVLKIYTTESTDTAAWDRIITQFAGGSAVSYEPGPEKTADRPDSQIDVAEMRRRWQALDHSHGFFAILRDLQIGRLQALRLAGDDLARQIDVGAARTLLEGASTGGVPIMCFVGNPGCIQIYSGPVDRVVMMGPWLNVLDPDFNLHLRTDLVTSAWIVTKPTSLRGDITSIELFDNDGDMVCQFFGQRPPGQDERPAWRDLAHALPSPQAS